MVRCFVGWCEEKLKRACCTQPRRLITRQENWAGKIKERKKPAEKHTRRKRIAYKKFEALCEVVVSGTCVLCIKTVWQKCSLSTQWRIEGNGVTNAPQCSCKCVRVRVPLEFKDTKFSFERNNVCQTGPSFTTVARTKFRLLKSYSQVSWFYAFASFFIAQW
jgi:hypothetical protein